MNEERCSPGLRSLGTTRAPPFRSCTTPFGCEPRLTWRTKDNGSGTCSSTSFRITAAKHSPSRMFSTEGSTCPPLRLQVLTRGLRLLHTGQLVGVVAMHHPPRAHRVGATHIEDAQGPRPAASSGRYPIPYNLKRKSALRSSDGKPKERPCHQEIPWRSAGLTPRRSPCPCP